MLLVINREWLKIELLVQKNMSIMKRRRKVKIFIMNIFSIINFTNIQNVINSRPSNNIKVNLYLLSLFSTILQQKSSPFFYNFFHCCYCIVCFLKDVETFYLHSCIRIKICLKPNLAEFIDIYCPENLRMKVLNLIS